MATYIQGVTDYIPQIQPFVPDYNFYSGALQFQQGKHDAARKQLSSVYGSLLNAPLTREDNSLAREKFFKTIEQDIHKMSHMDLSLAQNSEAAEGVFNQLLDNKAITKDMVWTKQFNQQMQKGQYLKNCVDPEKCGGSWWEGGDRYMGYAREAFMTASADDAMGMSAPSYVAYQDVTKKAMAIAKDADLNVTMDTINGGYIITTKNGQEVEPAMQQLLLGTLGKDPKIAEYYKAKASVDRQDWTHSNLEQYGSLEAAEQAYVSQMSPAIEAMFQDEGEKIDDTIKQTDDKKSKIEKKLETALPDEKNKLLRLLQDFQNTGTEYESSKEVIDEVNGTVGVAKTNKRYTADQIDSIMAGAGLQTDILNAAHTLAYKDYERTVKEDPYSMESVKFQNRMLIEQFKHESKKQLLQYKNALENGTANVTETGHSEANYAETVTDIKGNTDPNADGETNQRLINSQMEQVENVEAGLSGDEISVMKQVLSRTTDAAERGDDPFAKKDYIDIVSNWLAALENDPLVWASDAETERDEYTGKPIVNKDKIAQQQKYKEIAAKLAKATSTAEKYNIAKSAGLDLNKLSGSQVDVLYDAVIPNMLNPKAGANSISRDYLDVVYANTKNLRIDIEAKNEVLRQLNKDYANRAKDVIKDMRTQKGAEMGVWDTVKDALGYDNTELKPGEGVFWADAFESYIDSNGHKVDEDAWVKSMLAKGSGVLDAAPEDLRDYAEDVGTEQALRSIYRGDVEEPGIFDWASGNLLQGTALGAITGGGVSLFTGTPLAVPIGLAAGAVGGAAKSIYENADKLMVAETGESIRGLEDKWKEAYTTYAETKGTHMWLGMQGGGNKGSMGGRYSLVDPASPRSIGFEGQKSFLKDAVRLGDQAIYTIGGFSKELPDETDPNAKIAADVLLNDISTMVKGANRPITTITYSDVAGSDANTIGLNIKLPPGYIKKYKGSNDNPGMMGKDDMQEKLVTEGLTIYLPKSEASNLFKQGAGMTGLEVLMEQTGKIDMNYRPDIFEDFEITRDQSTGMYRTHGHVKTGIKEDGSFNWEYFELMEPYGIDINKYVAKLDNLIKIASDKNEAIRKNYILENGLNLGLN